ncbi:MULTISPECIES: hypothetical protein [Streptomyces]|uniref:Uncharacterized protein n=1 Tax=Streptomyces bugieae TaxID=3098223 RepID=A0ABU7NIW3_9ACTN|nr:hypothetical protein [Streptomyces nigrescens]MEE4418814.1 hypothetical protein [Streptomyces sp. DSM 41528]
MLEEFERAEAEESDPADSTHHVQKGDACTVNEEAQEETAKRKN